MILVDGLVCFVLYVKIESGHKGAEKMKCEHCETEFNEEDSIQTMCESSNYLYSEQDKQWFSMQGFLERCKYCQNLLSGGYGDINFFNTEEEARRYSELFKIGVWE